MKLGCGGVFVKDGIACAVDCFRLIAVIPVSDWPSPYQSMRFNRLSKSLSNRSSDRFGDMWGFKCNFTQDARRWIFKADKIQAGNYGFFTKSVRPAPCIGD